jgi:hypothetical protein
MNRQADMKMPKFWNTPKLRWPIAAPGLVPTAGWPTMAGLTVAGLGGLCGRWQRGPAVSSG